MSVERTIAGALAIAACACGSVSQKLPRSGGDLPPPAESEYTFDAVARGRIVFDNACIRCHGLDAELNRAPAMRTVARRYRDALFDEDEAVERIASWIGSPTVADALLPDSVIRQWNVMTRVALDRDLAEDVGHWIWFLATDSAGRTR